MRLMSLEILLVLELPATALAALEMTLPQTRTEMIAPTRTPMALLELPELVLVLVDMGRTPLPLDARLVMAMTIPPLVLLVDTEITTLAAVLLEDTARTLLPPVQLALVVDMEMILPLLVVMETIRLLVPLARVAMETRILLVLLAPVTEMIRLIVLEAMVEMILPLVGPEEEATVMIQRLVLDITVMDTKPVMEMIRLLAPELMEMIATTPVLLAVVMDRIAAVVMRIPTTELQVM